VAAHRRWLIVTVMPSVVTLEMTISHAEFFRLLPDAVGGASWQAKNGHIRIAHPDGSVEIRLSPERIRRIATLHLAVTDVTLAFDGFPPEAVARFMARFHLYFQRGGG
jgi:hypothetical protein